MFTPFFLCISFMLGSFLSLIDSQPIFAEESTDYKGEVYQIIENKLKERIHLGFKDFQGLTPGKVFNMKDENRKETKYLVELEKNGSLAGYMVVDSLEGMVVEFALGNVHPLLHKTGEIFYLGPLFYGEVDNAGKIIDLRTKKEISEDILEKIRKRKADFTSKSISPDTIIYYDYDYIDNVPDYQQSDNTSMDNDCAPTAAATVIMYWDSHGYPNLSSTNNWIDVANVLGDLMDHNDENGVTSDKIEPAIESYITGRNYTNFSVGRDTSPTFSDIDYQIERDQPTLLRLEGYGYTKWPEKDDGHLVTIVGTESYMDTEDWNYYYNLVIHDNWEITPEDVWISFGRGGGETTDIWTVVP